MNFEFPIVDLPAVMRGPRVGRRRVLVGGSAFWGTMVEDGDAAVRLRLDDGRLVDAAAAACLPPVSPSEITAIHIAYRSRRIETRNQPKPTATPTYFTKPPTALNGHGGQIVKPADCKYLNCGRVVQEAHIGDETIWGPHHVVADFARHITRVAGDVILMGTPCDSRSVDAGDRVECEITNIGRMTGTVVAAPAPRAAALGVRQARVDKEAP